MSVTMMSRLMLRLHRNAAMASHNDSTLSTDFGSVFSTTMISDSQLVSGSFAVTDAEALTNM
jgi:hypothetical protein